MGKPNELPDATDAVHGSAPPFFETLEPPVPEASDGIQIAMDVVPEWDDFFA